MSNDGTNEYYYSEWFQDWIEEWEELVGGFFLAGMIYFNDFVTPKIKQVKQDFHHRNVTLKTFKTICNIGYGSV